jgi:hypothetical protein
MKKWILIGVVAVAPLFSQAQMKAQWHNGRGKYVCAAYGYGKFTGETGKRHKYVPRGRKLVKGRSHPSMRRHFRKRQQSFLRIFNPH